MLLIIATAIGVRVLALLVAVIALDVPLQSLPTLRDGRSYLAYAAAVSGGREGFEQLSAYDRRVFPGYPLILGMLQAHRWPFVAIALSVLCAAGAAALAYVVFGDFRVGLGMAVLTPSYLLYSTTIMNESLILLLGLASLYWGARTNGLASGALLGVIAVIRPLAVPVGVAYVIANRQRVRVVAIAIASTIAVIAVAMAWLYWWSGSPLAGIGSYTTETRAYGDGAVFEWPFASLIRNTFHGAPLWKIAYVWAHVAFVLGGLALSMRDRNPVWLAWLGLNTLIVVCIGGIWGFHEFHRFLLPALPPLLFSWRRFLPKGVLPWTLLALASAGAAAVGLSHGF